MTFQYNEGDQKHTYTQQLDHNNLACVIAREKFIAQAYVYIEHATQKLSFHLSQ